MLCKDNKKITENNKFPELFLYASVSLLYVFTFFTRYLELFCKIKNSWPQFREF